MILPLGLILLGAAPAAEPPSPRPNPMKICRAGERETGSHIHAGRICKTAEEWERLDAARDRTPLSLTVTEGQQDGQAPKPPQ